MLNFKNKIKLNNLLFVCCTLLIAVLASPAHSQNVTDTIDELTEKVQQACPTPWEDLKSKMEDTVSENLWSDENDQNAYLEFKSFSANNVAALSDTAIIHADCTQQRLNLLNALYGNLPQKTLVAMSSIDYQPGKIIDGFEVGDIRHTSRVEAADGWLFVTGQTIGNADSGAILAGEEYKELYFLASKWSHNNSDGNSMTVVACVTVGDAVCEAGSSAQERWDSGEKLTLPNAQGRTIVGATAPGQTHASASALPSSSGQIGATLGEEKHKLTAAEMPSHNHSMNTAGNHSHNIKIHRGDYGNAHRSILRTNAHGNVYNTVVTNSVTAAGNHKHTINSKGGNTPHNVVQPSIFFNTEMKYSSRR